MVIRVNLYEELSVENMWGVVRIKSQVSRFGPLRVFPFLNEESFFNYKRHSLTSLFFCTVYVRTFVCMGFYSCHLNSLVFPPRLCKL